MALPGKPECCWTATAPDICYPVLANPVVTDVAIVGAGIVGLTAGYSLVQAGFAVAVLESRRVGRQVTGRSTAKITSQHSLIYRYLIDTAGFDKARHYADASRTGAQQISSWIADLRIDCEFEPKDAYVFTSDLARRADIVAEAEAAQSVGFNAEVLGRAPLPFATAAALRFPDQAQFNPVQYLIGLAGAAAAAGALVFESTCVTAIDSGKRWRLTTKEGSVEAQHVVIATNLPFAAPVEYDRRTQPRCHIAMAFRTEVAIDGMFIGIDPPTHSLRMGRDRQGPLLIVLGPSFNTGQDGDVAGRFRELEGWVRGNLPVGEAAWRWVNEDFNSADRIPYVGAPSTKAAGLYVATGFNGWGITNGTAAGLLIADQIQGRPNPWASLYNPTRAYPKDFHQSGKSQSRVESTDDIAPGAGAVITIGKQELAVWKDTDGRPHVLSAACTHKGCTVTWNNAARTWDCPCHGSMFEADGSVIHGPAVEPLRPGKLPT